MGYSTRHKLKIHEGSETIREIMKENKDLEGLHYSLDENGVGEEPRKWYSHTEEMLELSKRYPNTVFSLKGDGEEQGDSWYKYFKSGKVQVCRAEIEYAPYNESKLKNPDE